MVVNLLAALPSGPADAVETASHAHRGSAPADFNNDGRIDLVVSVIG